MNRREAQEKKDRSKTRLSRRVCVLFHASFESAEGTASGNASDISQGGMLFCSPQRLYLHEKGLFRLDVFQGEIPVIVTGEIVHVRQDKKSPEIQYGIKFTEPVERETVARVLRFSVLRHRYLSRKE